MSSMDLKKVLVTTSSFLDTPGPHRTELDKLPLVVTRQRGPLSAEQLLECIEKDGPFDGFLVGEDEFTAEVLERIAPHCVVISRYGVGLDKIDLEAATRLGIKVTNTPGVNHTTVTELTFGLIFSLLRSIPEHNSFVQQAQWRRTTGVELSGKNLGIFGFGRVGQEVAKRAMAFGVNVLVYNTSWSPEHQQLIDELNAFYRSSLFAEKVASSDLRSSAEDFKVRYPSIKRYQRADDLLADADILSIHMNLTKHNVHFFNRRRLSLCKRGVFIVNVSRGGLIDEGAMAYAVRGGHVAGYAADVVEHEPVTDSNPLLKNSRIIITPHIGSRTTESVVRQGQAALKNLVSNLFPQISGEVLDNLR